MSEDRSSSGQRSWLEKITQAFAHEPRSREELLELLREAQRNKLIDSEALSIVEGAIQVADLQVRDIMVPRSQMVSIKACQTPREFLPAIIDAVLDAPVVEATAGDSDEFFADLEALDNAQATMKMHGADIQAITSTFFAEFSALDFGGDA